MDDVEHHRAEGIVISANSDTWSTQHGINTCVVPTKDVPIVRFDGIQKTGCLSWICWQEVRGTVAGARKK